MPAYLKLPDIEGEVEEKEHQKWIEVESVSMPIYRSITEGAVGSQRKHGETSLGDVVVVKKWDSSTPLIAEAAASGKHMREVVIHFCGTINNKNVVNLEVKLKDVVLTGWNFAATGTQEPIPTEQITMNYTEIEWIYKRYDRMGDEEGNFPAGYKTTAAG